MCFRVKSCCGCNSLESGAKGIAIFGIVVSILQFISGLAQLHVGTIVSAIIAVLLSYMLLYGTKAGKPAYLMAWMVLTMIELVLSIALGFFLIAMAIMVDTDWEEVKEFLLNNGFEELATPEMKETLLIILWVIAALILSITAVYLHFWSVVYSLYKKQQESFYGTHLLNEDDKFELGQGKH